MPNLQATSRNQLIGRLADLLQSGKSAANQYQILPQIPLVGGTGLGDLFMGKAPELVDDISYDGLRAAVRGGNAATGGIGTYGARPAVADATLLGMDVTGLGKGLGSLSKKSAGALYDKLLEGGTSLSRRDALKKLGAIAGSTALAGTGVGALRKLSDNVVSEAVHTAPKVVDNVAAAATKNYKFNSLAEYLNHVRGIADEEAMMQHAELGGMGDVPEHYSTDWMKNILKQDSQAYTNAKDIESGYLKLDKESLPPSPMSIEFNPTTGQYETIEYINAFSPQAKQEMRDYKSFVSDKNANYGWNTSLQRKLNPNMPPRQVDWTNPDIMMNYLDMSVGDIPF